MIATALLMVAASHIIGKHYLFLLVNVSCETTLAPTLWTGVSVAGLVFL